MTRTALFVRWVLGIVAAVFLALGLLYIFFPKLMISAIGIEDAPKVAMADIRAIYGGLDLFLGIVLGMLFLRKDWAAGLGLGALALTCIFIGRLTGILLDGANDILTFGLFASEVIGAVLCGVGWFLARKPEPELAAVATPVSISEPTIVHTEPLTDTPNPAEPNENP